jgi:putative ABC transport system permease protein
VQRTILVREGGVLQVIAIASLVVLVGGCATLMALVLVHYERRRREFAVRLAIGAARVRLLGQLAGELAWLVTAAGCAALIVAFWAVRLLPSLSLPGGVDMGRLDLSLDLRVLGAGVIVSAVTVAVGACVPLLRFTCPQLAQDLIGQTASATAGSVRLRQTMLAVHVTATVVVMVAASLFVRTVQHGFSTGLGVDTDRTLFVRVDQGAPPDLGALLAATRRRGLTPEVRGQLETQLAVRHAPVNRAIIDAVTAVPGVRSVGIGPPLLGPDEAANVATPIALDIDGERRTIRIGFVPAGPAYLDSLQPTILQGRLLTSGDAVAELRPRPVVASVSLASMLWPGRSAVGQRLRLGYSSPSSEYEVVGVIQDIAFGSLRFDPALTLFTAADGRAEEGRVLRLVVRWDDSRVSDDTVRKAIAPLLTGDGRVTITTAREMLAADLGRERLGAWFFSGFSLVAFVLGIGGVFGLVAYLAESRRREFGIRLALGASLTRVLWISISAGVLPVMVGTVSGLIGASWLASASASLVHGISRLDGVSYAGGAFLMLAAAATASTVAAWRVRRISASYALRAE